MSYNDQEHILGPREVLREVPFMTCIEIQSLLKNLTQGANEKSTYCFYHMYLTAVYRSRDNQLASTSKDNRIGSLLKDHHVKLVQEPEGKSVWRQALPVLCCSDCSGPDAQHTPA